MVDWFLGTLRLSLCPQDGGPWRAGLPLTLPVPMSGTWAVPSGAGARALSEPTPTSVFDMANSAPMVDDAWAPLLLRALTKELDLIFHSCESPVSVFISFSPSRSPRTPLSQRPQQQLAPPRQPESAARTPAACPSFWFNFCSFKLLRFSMCCDL